MGFARATTALFLAVVLTLAPGASGSHGPRPGRGQALFGRVLREHREGNVPAPAPVLISGTSTSPDPETDVPAAHRAAKDKVVQAPLTATTCQVPTTFQGHVALCDAKLCSAFLWQDALLPDITPGLKTCRQACSSIGLGAVDATVSREVRAGCRNQCKTLGYKSYVCQVRSSAESHSQNARAVARA